MQVLDRAQVGEVEDRADVDEERIVALPGEHHLSAAQFVHGFFFEFCVVGRGARADVAGGAGEILAQLVGALAVAARDVEELAFAPVGVFQRADRSGVVEERVFVEDLRLERELVGDIGAPVAVVVDVDAVENVVAELEEGRTTGRHLGGEVVGDDGYRFWIVGTDECVRVGVIGDGVCADLRRLAVR